MKKTLLTLAAIVACITMSAQGLKNDYIKIWPDQVPGSKDKKAEHGFYEREGWCINKVTDPTLEIYTPTAYKDNHQAVIVCPGGAYAMLAYTKEGQEVAEWLAGQGYTAYVLAYRVPNNRAGALQDAQRSIRIARQRGAKKVGIIGFSAGASLSCRAATRFGEQLYQPQDAADQLSCRPDFAMLIYPAYLDEGDNHTLTPELTVNGETPQMFIFGTHDDVKYSGPSCPTIYNALLQNGIPTELHYLPKGGHGYGMRSGAGFIWPSLCEQWLKLQR